MERVAFLLEDTGECLGCLLNPESLVIRRRAGVRQRQSAGGLVAGADRRDDPLLCTGGGSTELTLDLVFDVSLAGLSVVTDDVRDLTRPLWELAENTRLAGSYRKPPLCLFVWGKVWKVPGIVTAVAERLEHFNSSGAPGRSWLRMRLLRVIESVTASAQGLTAQPVGALGLPTPSLHTLSDSVDRHEVIGGSTRATGEDISVTSERLDQLAYRYYGDANLWRALAERNHLEDPIHLPAGHRLEVPPISDWQDV